MDGATSDTVPVVSGVPQYTILGPLLFLIFINDLPNCVQSRIRLFADDCILYRKIRPNEDTIILQDDLNKLADWEQKWGMDFHPDKCSTLHVARSRTPIMTTRLHSQRTQTNIRSFIKILVLEESY